MFSRACQCLFKTVAFLKQLYQRDIGGATGEDNFDFAALPKVLQVKNFGKMSRTKWTHLR